MKPFYFALQVTSTHCASRFVLKIFVLSLVTLVAPSSYAEDIPLIGHRGFNLGTMELGRKDDPNSLGAKYLKTGSSIARLHVRFDLKDEDNNPKLTTIEDWLPLLKPAIKVLNQNGQVAVVSLHNPTKAKPNANRIIGPKFIKDWAKLSNGLAGIGAPQGVWYDLWNEPPNTRQRQKLLQKTAEVIRGIEKTLKIEERPIVVPSVGDRSTSVVDFKPLDNIRNQIIGVHFWDMHKLTHGWLRKWDVLSKRQKKRLKKQGALAVQEAKETATSEWDMLSKKQRKELRKQGPAAVKASKEKPHIVFNPKVRYKDKAKGRIEKALASVAKISDDFILPVFIGELGMFAEHPDAGEYFSDVLEILDEQHPDFNVAIHAWKEANVWDYENKAYYEDEILEYIASAPQANLVGNSFLEAIPDNAALANITLGVQNETLGMGGDIEIARIVTHDDLREPIITPEPTSAILLLVILVGMGYRQRYRVHFFELWA